jgi:hypothetical protein
MDMSGSMIVSQGYVVDVVLLTIENSQNIVFTTISRGSIQRY